MEAGDTAFLALQGYAPIIPGYVPDWEPLIKKYHFHVLVPGCEVIYLQAQMDFCGAARAYAERYNSTLVSRVRANAP